MIGERAIRHERNEFNPGLPSAFRQKPRDIIRNRRVNRGQYGLLLGRSGQDPAAGASPIVFAAIAGMRPDLEARHSPVAQGKGQTAQENAKHDASDHAQVNISIPLSIPYVLESLQILDRPEPYPSAIVTRSISSPWRIASTMLCPLTTFPNTVCFPFKCENSISPVGRTQFPRAHFGQ